MEHSVVLCDRGPKNLLTGDMHIMICRDCRVFNGRWRQLNNTVHFIVSFSASDSVLF